MSQTPQLFLGIDVSQKKLDVALLHEGHKTHFKSVPNTPPGHLALLEWLQSHDNHDALLVHACFEATAAFADEAATALHDVGHRVSIVNPACTHAFAKSQLKRTKSDKVDSLVIAHFCRAQQPAPWKPVALEIRQLQGLVRRLEHLKEMLVMEKNRLAAGGQNSLCGSPVRRSIEEHIAHLEQQIETTQQQIKDHIDQNPGLKANARLLHSIPGLGEATVALLLGELGDMSQFPTARQVAAFAGLTPCERVSGTSLHSKPRLSKIGSCRLRKALYLPAMTALRYNPLVKAFGLRLAAKGKAKMQVLGAAMRKLLHQAFGVLRSQTAFDPGFLTTKP